MGLVIAQLLFIEQPDPDRVLLDVIVIDCAEAAQRPEVGAPIALGLGLPHDDEERSRALTVLGNWARRGAVVDIAIRARRGADEVVLRSGVASIALLPRVPHGTADPGQ